MGKLIYQPTLVFVLDGMVDTADLPARINVADDQGLRVTGGVAAVAVIPPFETGTPTNLDDWIYNSTTGLFEHVAPSGGGDATLIYANTSNGVVSDAVAAFERDFLTATALDADELEVGSVLRQYAHFNIKFSAFSPKTITIRFKFDSVNLITFTVTGTNTSYLGVGFLVLSICRSTGASGTILSTRKTEAPGIATSEPAANLATIDTTSSLTPKITGQWSSSGFGQNACVLRNWTVELLEAA